jgi:hypothetical protein
MNPIESSVLVRTLRRVGRSSVLVNGVAAIARGFRRLDQAIAQAAADKDSADDRARVRAIIADSWLVGALERLFAAPEVAWRYSRVRPIAESIRDSVRALELHQRIRLLGWMIIVAVVTRAALFVLVGNRPSAITLAVWAVIVAIGALMMSASASIGVAWVDWRQRRGF